MAPSYNIEGVRVAVSKTVHVVTQNARMRAIISQLEKAAQSDRTVLLIGETGVGKEVFSDFIHYNSARSEAPFVKIGLASIPVELLESELFGHEKGAFTSASSDRKGMFELAHGGTLFLDDIDDVPLSVQAKLLRVLESGELMHIGGSVVIPVDVRVIAATKVDLRHMVDQKLFRADLYYRLNVVPIEIPPLRERRDDIMLLAEHLAALHAADKRIVFSESAAAAMTRYDWPGNIRELRNIVQRLALLSEGEIGLQDLPSEFLCGSSSGSSHQQCEHCLLDREMTLDEVVSCLEKNLVHRALLQAEWNITQAAKALRLSPSTLRDKIRKYGLTAL